MTHAPQAPTMADVARLAGVSPMTVSRAFKTDSSVSDATRDAILKAADGLGYVFDSTASNLRSQKTDFIAVTIPSINNANFAETVRGLSEGLKPRGLQILLGYTDYDMAEEERLIEQFLRRRPEAIVVTGGRHTPRARRMLDNAGIPVIETWDLPEDPIGHVVGFSNAGGAGDGRSFRGQGPDAHRLHRRRHHPRHPRRRPPCGFIAAMQARGLDATRLIAAGPPPISMREGADAMGRLLDTLPDTQAVICVSDLSAFGALTECQRRGVAVPGRICHRRLWRFRGGRRGRAALVHHQPLSARDRGTHGGADPGCAGWPPDRCPRASRSRPNC
jgi:LacI family transcriptional regulator, gluconate utilization system Gnt-I transcriptional repressor